MKFWLSLLILLTIPTGVFSQDVITGNQTNISFLLSESETVLNQFESGMFDSYTPAELEPDLEYLYIHLAMDLTAEGKLQEAADVLQLIPQTWQTRQSKILYAFILCRLQEYDAAVTCLNELRVQYPDDPTLDNAVAYILVLAGHPDEAGTIEERVVRLLPDSPEVQDTWGTILAAQGDQKRAQHYLEKAYNSLPDDAEVLCHLAEVYATTKRVADAEDLFQKAVRIDPYYGPGQKGYAEVLIQMGRYQEAAPVMLHALRLLPHDPDLIKWEKENDERLLSWHIRQEQEAKYPLFTKRMAPENHSENHTPLA